LLIGYVIADIIIFFCKNSSISNQQIVN